MAARTFRKKKQQQSRVFFDVIWEKELERVIENKRDEFCRKKNMNIQSRCETIGPFILGLQPRDKAAMLGVKTKEYFLEEFTWK